MFQKNLALHKEFWYRSIIFFIESLFTIIFTIYTKSPAGLVAGLISGAIIELLISHIFVFPRPRIEFNSIKLKKIIRNGKWVTLYGIFNYLSEELDNTVVAKMLGVSSLGIYDLAYKFSYLPISEVSDVVSRVVFPVYAKILNDRKRLISAFLKSTFSISVVVILFGLGIFVFSTQIVVLILGQKWLAAGEVLRFLVLYGVIRGIFGPFSALFLAVGKQNYVASMTAARVLTLTLTIIPLIMFFGIFGAVYSAILSALVEAPVAVYYAYRLLNK
jgi:O-antigen/teichoic acid export membrane protein